jgi:hypothetical protein
MKKGAKSSNFEKIQSKWNAAQFDVITKMSFMVIEVTWDKTCVKQLGKGKAVFKHQRMNKEFFFVNYNTLLHISTLLGHLQGETFRCLYTRLHYTVKREFSLNCIYV